MMARGPVTATLLLICLAALSSAAATCDCDELEALHDKLSDAAFALTKCRKELAAARGGAAREAAEACDRGDLEAEVRRGWQLLLLLVLAARCCAGMHRCMPPRSEPLPGGCPRRRPSCRLPPPPLAAAPPAAAGLAA